MSARCVHLSSQSAKILAMLHWKRCKEWAIVTFCVWHMVAVTLFLVTTSSDASFGPIVAKAKTITAPYVFSLSQWQYWNIFAPDPLQRSSTYDIDLLAENGTWLTMHRIDYDRLRWNERAKEFKILENLEDNWQTLVPSYLQTFCTSLHLLDGNTIRLMATSFVLPTELRALRHSAALELPISEKELGSVICAS